MSVTGDKLHSPKPTTGLQILKQLLPALFGFSEMGLEARNLPMALLTDADYDHRPR
jgi:hypothetical protein